MNGLVGSVGVVEGEAVGEVVTVVVGLGEEDADGDGDAGGVGETVADGEGEVVGVGEGEGDGDGDGALLITAKVVKCGMAKSMEVPSALGVPSMKT